MPNLNGDDVQHVYAISGLGGMGKTQTALQFMFQNIRDFAAVLWVPAESYIKMANCYLEFGVQSGLVRDREIDQNEAVGVVKSWFTDIGLSTPYVPNSIAY